MLLPSDLPLNQTCWCVVGLRSCPLDKTVIDAFGIKNGKLAVGCPNTPFRSHGDWCRQCIDRVSVAQAKAELEDVPIDTICREDQSSGASQRACAKLVGVRNNGGFLLYEVQWNKGTPKRSWHSARYISVDLIAEYHNLTVRGPMTTTRTRY